MTIKTILIWVGGAMIGAASGPLLSPSWVLGMGGAFVLILASKFDQGQ